MWCWIFKDTLWCAQVPWRRAPRDIGEEEEGPAPRNRPDALANGLATARGPLTGALARFCPKLQANVLIANQLARDQSKVLRAGRWRAGERAHQP